MAECKGQEVRPLRIPCTPWSIRLFAWALAFTAFILSAVAVKSCRFVRAEVINYGGNTSIVDPPTSVSVSKYRFGLYRFDYEGTCVSYGDTIDELLGFQGSMKAARAMGALSPLLGGFAMLIVFASFFVRIRVMLWRVVGGTLFLCAIFQSLTFVVFNTSLCDSEYYNSSDVQVSTSCKVDEGAKIAISSIVMYIIAGMAMFQVPAPDKLLIKFDMMDCGTPNATESPCNNTCEVGKPRSDADASDGQAFPDCPDDEHDHDITATMNSDDSRTLVNTNGLPYKGGRDSPFEMIGGEHANATESTCNNETPVVGKPRSDAAASDVQACPDDKQDQYIAATVNSDGSRTLVVKNGVPSDNGESPSVSPEVYEL